MKRENDSYGHFSGSVDELWTVDDVASYLRKPVSWVYDNHKYYFHAARAGRQLLFSSSEIKSWVAGQMRPFS